MISFINLVFAFFFPGLLEWWIRWNAKPVVEASLDQGEFAKALAAIAGILILGLGGVLIIGMSGRWFRRWAFRKNERTSDAFGSSSLEKVNWAKPVEESNDEG